MCEGPSWGRGRRLPGADWLLRCTGLQVPSAPALGRWARGLSLAEGSCVTLFCAAGSFGGRGLSCHRAIEQQQVLECHVHHLPPGQSQPRKAPWVQGSTPPPDLSPADQPHQAVVTKGGCSGLGSGPSWGRSMHRSYSRESYCLNLWKVWSPAGGKGPGSGMGGSLNPPAPALLSPGAIASWQGGLLGGTAPTPAQPCWGVGRRAETGPIEPMSPSLCLPQGQYLAVVGVGVVAEPGREGSSHQGL